MQLDLMSFLLHLSLIPVEALLELADEGMVPPVGLLLLLPLHRVLLGLVPVHLIWVNTAPPDIKLVLAKLALQAPLLGVGTAHVVLELKLAVGLVGAALPGAGVADVGVNRFDVHLPVTYGTKALLAILTLEGPDLVMNSLNVLGKRDILAELQATFSALVMLFLLMNNLVMPHHDSLLSKPLSTLWTLVIYSLVCSLLMFGQATSESIALVTFLHITIESFYI